MLFLVFELGRSRYALDAAQVLAVLPLLSLAEIPLAPAGVAGVFDYHGAPVPAIDLCALALGRPAARRLSTRILMVRVASEGRSLPVGLIAERATAALRFAPGALAAAAATGAPGSPFLGRLLPDPGGLIQWLEVDALLPAPLRAALTAAAAAP